MLKNIFPLKNNLRSFQTHFLDLISHCNLNFIYRNATDNLLKLKWVFYNSNGFGIFLHQKLPMRFEKKRFHLNKK